MALTFSNQAVIAFKNLSGKSNTDVDKFLGNEAEGIFQNVDFSKVWTNSSRRIKRLVPIEKVRILLALIILATVHREIPSNKLTSFTLKTSLA